MKLLGELKPWVGARDVILRVNVCISPHQKAILLAGGAINYLKSSFDKTGN